MFRERSGAMIKIDDARPGEDYRVITISGGKDQIDDAHAMLQDWYIKFDVLRLC